MLSHPACILRRQSVLEVKQSLCNTVVTTTHCVRDLRRTPRTRRQYLSIHAPLYYSTAASSFTSPTPPPSPRWLSDQKARLGKCVMFGLAPDSTQIDLASRIAGILGAEWQGLVAGPEGFQVVPEEGWEGKGKVLDRERRLPTAWTEKVIWSVQDAMGVYSYLKLCCELRLIPVLLLLGHVNNVNYARYSESSRIWYFRRLGTYVAASQRKDWDDLISPRGIGLILKGISVDFLFPLQYPDSISVYHRLAAKDASKSSLELRSTILSHKHQRPAARVREDIVLYDYRIGKKAEIPTWINDVLQSTEELEHRSRQYWSTRRSEVEDMLADLESQTILSGKEEDMGGGMR